MRKSELLSQKTFEELLQGAAVLERDERGVKVLRLSDGDILKIFRVRHKISRARIYSYARRFCWNADRLAAKNVPTVQVKQLLHLEQSAETAVRYVPLAGETLRDIIKVRLLTLDEANKLGKFIAQLHQSGIYFRSLHLGNIVLGKSAELGLIDVADISIYPWPLWCNTRARSFLHFHRYPEQVLALGTEVWQVVQNAYFDEARLSDACSRHLQEYLHKISVFR